jgi:hypothetical protein
MHWPKFKISLEKAPKPRRFRRQIRSFWASSAVLCIGAWLVLSALIPVLKCWQDAVPLASSSDSAISVSELAASRIEAPHRHCMHHPVACPPDCHCPSLANADDSVTRDTNQMPSDLIPGEAAYYPCQSASDWAWGASFQSVYFVDVNPSFIPGPDVSVAWNEAILSRWTSLSQDAPEKVPIFSFSA